MCHADFSRKTAEQLLLEQISRMCVARILSRLRSKHAAKTQKIKCKRPMPLLLAEIISQCRNEPAVAPLQDRATMLDLYRQSDTLKGAFEKLEYSDDQSLLLQHVTEILSLAHHFNIWALESTLEHSHVMNPSLKQYLPRAVKKLGRYCAIATDLINASRTTSHTLFRRISVQPIEPPKSLNDGTLIATLTSFDAVWSRITSKAAHGQAKLLRAKTMAKYQNRIIGSHTKFKVHAEMQILCFYEQRPHLPKPRIICASKSACYLCNQFLKIHGQFTTPRTHGKIYDRWTLPLGCSLDKGTLRRLLPAVHELNGVVEMATLTALKGQIRQHAPPNESVLAVYEPWSSASSIVRQHSMRLGANDSRPDRANNEYLPRDEDLKIDTLLESVVTVSVQSADDTCTTFLEPGEQVCKDLDQVVCLHVETRSIHLQFSWSNGSPVGATRSVAVKECYRVRVECLSDLSELTHDTRRFDVNRLERGRSDVILYGSGSIAGRVVLTNGSHRVLVAFEKVLGSNFAGDA